MSNNWTTAPNLQSILATLASFNNPANPCQETPAIETSRLSQSSTPPSNDQSRPSPQGKSATPTGNAIDPATITTWKDGLRCVTKMAAQNKHFAQSIRELIAQQRSHELKWYQERQDLKKRQAQRALSSAKALSILSNLNQNQPVTSSHTPPPQPPPSQSAEEELQSFDRKIYGAQKSLDEHHGRILKGLGVPFFGTESTLILSDAPETSGLELPDDRPSWSPVVRESELVELRRRMVGHLEDLYRDVPV